MSHATNARETSDRTRSDLAVLVDTEARIDRDLARAREQAATLDRETDERMRQADADLAAEIDRERTRISDEVAAEAKVRALDVEQTMHAQIAGFDAIRDERAVELARSVVEELLALVRAEGSP